MGRIFACWAIVNLGIFYITEVAQIFVLLFIKKYRKCIKTKQKELGYTLGDFFTNASGRRAPSKSLLTKCFPTVPPFFPLRLSDSFLLLFSFFFAESSSFLYSSTSGLPDGSIFSDQKYQFG
jgi:hypothetical protein